MIVFATIVFSFLIYGVVLWRLAATSELDMTAELIDYDDQEARVLLEQQMNTPNSEPSEAVDDAQLLLLAYDVEKFRDGTVFSPSTKAIAELSQVMPGVFNELLEGEISTKFPIIWPYVMAGSFVVIGNTLGDDPIVAFYNPYFDIALLTKWNFKTNAETTTGTGFKLTQVVPVTGRAFIENRSSLSTDHPVWTDSEEIFEVKIIQAAHHFVTTFEERYPPLEREAAELAATDTDVVAQRTAISVAETRVFSLLQWIIDAQNPDAPVNYAAEIEQLRDAFSADSPDELAALLPKDNPQTAESFFQLKPDILKSMKPYLVIDKNVIFISPVNYPTGFISVYFNPADQGYELGLALLFDLDISNYEN